MQTTHLYKQLACISSGATAAETPDTITSLEFVVKKGKCHVGFTMM